MTTPGLSKRQVYGHGAAAGMLARGVETVGGVAQLWLLTQILGKAPFGRFVFVLAIVQVLALASASGFERLVVFRLARADAPAGVLAGRPFAGAVLGWALLVAFAVAVPGGAILAATAGGTDPGVWVAGLAALIPIQAATAVYAGWHQARQRLPEAIARGRALPGLLVVAFLLVAWRLEAGAAGAVAALVAGPLLAFALWFARRPADPWRLRARLARADARYAAETTAASVVSHGLQHSDLIMLGALAGPLAAAEFAVVLKLALLLRLGHGLLGPILAPRIGALLGAGRRAELRHEFDQNRLLATLFALGLLVPLAAVGPALLRRFGDYEVAYPLLLMVCAAPLAIVTFGASGQLLMMAGHSRWSLVTNAALLAGNIALNAILIPPLGALGAAIATGVSVVLVKASAAGLVWRLERIATVSLPVAIGLGLSITTLVLGAAGPLTPPAVAGVLATILGGLTVVRWRTIRTVAGAMLHGPRLGAETP